MSSTLVLISQSLRTPSKLHGLYGNPLCAQTSLEQQKEHALEPAPVHIQSDNDGASVRIARLSRSRLRVYERGEGKARAIEVKIQVPTNLKSEMGSNDPSRVARPWCIHSSCKRSYVQWIWSCACIPLDLEGGIWLRLCCASTFHFLAPTVYGITESGISHSPPLPSHSHCAVTQIRRKLVIVGDGKPLSLH